MRLTPNDLIVHCVQGDIVDQPDIDVIVNAANADLRPGGGVAGAIHRAAGPGLAVECRPLAPIEPGTAVMTTAHRLPNRYIVHCLGPVYGRDEPADVLLASCYRRALELAEGRGAASIAFPAISTGAFGYPIRPAATVAIDTILDAAPRLRALRHVRLVLRTGSDLAIHESALTDALRRRAWPRA